MPRFTPATRILLVALLLCGTPNAGDATTRAGIELDRAWRDYLMNDQNLQPSYRFPHTTCFRAAAAEHDLPETLLLAVARGESDFEATAKSRANAHGVMQILWPTTARHLGIYRLTDLYDPCTNIDAGARYLKELLAGYDGNLHLALAAYNYGPERISTTGVGIPPGAEWYSGYIYRHLDYVLGDRNRSRSPGEHLYSDLGRSTLLSFAEPYRAAAFVARLEQDAPELRLDWFRKGVGKFVVVLIYRNREEFARSASLLSRAGFRFD